MENFQKIAVLIDADNTQLSKLEAVLHEVSAYGRIVVKKAYGNWRKDSLKHWEPELKRLAIRAEQQFDYVAGKNTTDIAMVIGAMDLLHNNMYDALVLVSSDSDFTPLAIRLRESGLYIIGAGVTTTPESFKNACDDFILIDYLSKADEKPAAAEHAAEPAAKKPARKTKKTTRSTKKPTAEAAPSAEPEPKRTRSAAVSSTCGRSALFTSTSIRRARRAAAMASSSSRVSGAEPSSTSSASSARCAACCARSTPSRSTVSAASRMPAVSHRRSSTLPTSTFSSTVSRVVPAMSVTMARS